jgi:hypothetical protein
MYNVYQHWDPLKVCIVGRSYNPKFYDYIKNDKVRKVFYRIAEETEEDYQKLINLLESFNVKVLRPEVSDNYHDYLINNSVLPTPMTPRDYSAMIGNNFYINTTDLQEIWNNLQGTDWPPYPKKFQDWPKWIVDECKTDHNVCFTIKDYAFNNVLNEISPHANIIFNRIPCTNINYLTIFKIFIGTIYWRKNSRECVTNIWKSICFNYKSNSIRLIISSRL